MVLILSFNLINIADKKIVMNRIGGTAPITKQQVVRIDLLNKGLPNISI